MSDVVTIEDNEESEEKEEKTRRGNSKKSDANTKIELLPYEQSLMIDTFAEDVLFIMARGLGLEQLVLNHLHLYSDRRFTVLVINTTQEDEHYFLDNLKVLNKDCPPKHITADVLSKDRELIYKVGGVQFVTSRILMVDLLTNRVPIDKVAGIVVYRAHEILAGYQESFILRLFREKKKNGFVKAFTDDPARIFFAGLGQLQRLVDKLYVKRVVVVPRFDASVKQCFDSDPPKFTQVSVDLPQNQKKIRNLLADIMNTCIRELKQCTHGLDVNTATDKMACSAALSQTELEADLRKKTLLLSERQERILTDLRILRKLSHKVEDLDPTKAWSFIYKIRTDKDIIEKNSGWIFTQTASTIFSSVESLVFVKNSKGYRTITAPPKWSGLNSVLKELAIKIMRSRSEEASESPVLVLVSNEQTCRQLIDLVKFGEEKFCWMLTKGSYDGSRSGDFGPEPETHPIWNPVNVCFYDDQLSENDRAELLNEVRDMQKKAGRDRKRRKRGAKIVVDETKQPKLTKFGINRYPSERTIWENIQIPNATKANEKRRPEKAPLSAEIVPEGMLPEDPLTDHYSKQSEVGTKQSEGGLDADSSEDGTKKSNEEESDERNVNPEGIPESETNSNVTENLEELNSSINADGVDLSTLKSMLVFLSLGNRYNLLNCLQDLRPSHIVLYNIDIVSTRIIETFKAHHQELPMEMYALMYTDTTEEERYLVSINREQNAFETLIKEQGVLMVPNEYDVSRDSTSQLRKLTLRRDSRFNPPTETEIQPTVVVDMREFNSELPTVLYCRGIDVYPATLEVGDYVLSDEICVERKALDDLAQSLHNGRVFKQTEQMLRHYSKSILLIESSEKFRQRKVNGGPFQGELSRRSRETRLLLTVLIRTHPQLSLVWTFSPSHSAELFEEVKLDQSNPDVDIAVSIKSDDLAINRDVADDTLLGSAENENEIPTVNALFASKSKSLRLNSVLKRQLSNLPGLLGGDEEHLMRNCILLDTMQSTSQRGGEEAEESRSDASDSVMNVARLVQSSKDVLSKVLSNEKHAETLFEFFQTDFRLLPT